MNRYLLRKESFGGLLFDRETQVTTPVDEVEFSLQAQDNNTDVVVRAHTGFTTLSAPTKIFLVLTKRCNLHCIHCSNNSSAARSEQLDYSEVENLLVQCQRMGVFEIAINGGEPLCHPDFMAIIGLIQEKGFPIYLNTNGVCGQTYLEELSRANVRKIRISIDGLETTHDQIRGRGAFRKAVAAIRYLRQEGNEVRINFTLTRRSEADICGLIRLADELGCSLKIAPLVRVGRAKSLPELEYSSQEGQAIQRLIARYQQDQKVRIHVEIASSLVARHCPEVIANYHYQFTKCGIRRTHMSVDSNGSVYSTGCQTDFDAEGAVGNVREETLEHLWTKIAARNETLANDCERCVALPIEVLLVESFWIQRRTYDGHSGSRLSVMGIP